jgi:hypothetical protein
LQRLKIWKWGDEEKKEKAEEEEEGDL